MKLKEYIEHLQAIYDAEGDFELVSADDDEGNSYSSVMFVPSIEYLDLDEFILVAPEDVEDAKEFGADLKRVVCVN